MLVKTIKNNILKSYLQPLAKESVLLKMKIVAKMKKKLLQKSLIRKNIFLPAFEVILPS